ncbi:MAG TPA: hypothetical protein VFV67_18960 [Actinophytocola sp.]|uniref:hypothetical protein n=1 Tax=Actinophytocola sp. TaxID=1872138 RepID=UPI002DBC4671|nr:hypothetical protein [Actinophytocola sp.]HEU5472733.1 hypothetical protein [Actinophytocola sp.]
MEPLTAVTMVAAQYGLEQLIGAITGNPGLGNLTAELLGALSASEDRLGVRLAAIESRLDEVLEQSYITAIGSGLRTLVDAGTAIDPKIREDEFLRARDIFRDASASARSKLQIALAERYLLLCAFALGRDDAARNALARLNSAAFETVLESAQAYQHQAALAKATEQVERQGVPRRQVGHQVRMELDTIRSAAVEATGLAVQMLREAGVLAQRFHSGVPPELAKLSVPTSPALWFTSQLAASADKLAEIGVWSVQTNEVAPVQLGPLQIEWHHVQRQSLPPTQPVAPLPLSEWRSRGDWPVSPDVLYVNVEVHADPTLTLPLTLQLASPPEWQQFASRVTSLLGAFPTGERGSQATTRRDTGTTMPAGARNFRLACRSVPLSPDTPLLLRKLNKARLILGGVFVVDSPPVTQAGTA